jgi:hypothetical protein
MHPPIWDFSMTNVKSIDSKGTCATRLALILNPIVSIAQLMLGLICSPGAIQEQCSQGCVCDAKLNSSEALRCDCSITKSHI